MKRFLLALSLSFALLAGCASVPQPEHNGLETDTISNHEKKQMKHYLFSEYAYKDKLLYLKPDFEEVETYGDLLAFYEKINTDLHLTFEVKCKCGKVHLKGIAGIGASNNWKVPNPYFLSKDPEDTLKYISTANAEYIRISNFDDDFKYNRVLNKVELNKDFLVIDVRTNGGGQFSRYYQFLEKLPEYGGKILILQDNLSASTAEFPYILSIAEVTVPYTLIGTQSAGATVSGNIVTHKIRKISLKIPTAARHPLERNYLGEGKGYAPDIFIDNFNDLSCELKKLGVDLNGISLN